MTKKLENELLREFVRIDENLTNKTYTNSELDYLLEVFLTQLSSSSQVSKKTQLELLENIKEIPSIKESTRKREQDMAISQLKKYYYLDEPIDGSEAQAIERKAYLVLDLVDLEEVKETEEENFVKFLEDILRRKKKVSTYKISKIGDTKIEENLNDRLYSYFKDEINENLNEDSKDWDIPNNYINTFYLALRNLYLGQSELNRIKSLVSSGTNLKKAIKEVVPSKDKRRRIERLVRKHQSNAIKLDEARKKLY